MSTIAKISIFINLLPFFLYGKNGSKYSIEFSFNKNYNTYSNFFQIPNKGNIFYSNTYSSQILYYNWHNFSIGIEKSTRLKIIKSLIATYQIQSFAAITAIRLPKDTSHIAYAGINLKKLNLYLKIFQKNISNFSFYYSIGASRYLGLKRTVKNALKSNTGTFKNDYTELNLKTYYYPIPFAIESRMGIEKNIIKNRIKFSLYINSCVVNRFALGIYDKNKYPIENFPSNIKSINLSVLCSLN